MMDKRILRLGNTLLGTAIIMDVLATIEGVSRGYREMNPVVHYLMGHLGTQAVTYLGMVELGALVAVGHFLMQHFGNNKTVLFGYTQLVAIVASLHIWTAMNWIFLITSGR